MDSLFISNQSNKAFVLLFKQVFIDLTKPTTTKKPTKSFIVVIVDSFNNCFIHIN